MYLIITHCADLQLSTFHIIMIMENLTSIEFLERIKSQKELHDIRMEYSDLSGRHIENITVKNSKFFFVVFRRCSFKNVTFENCEFFFCAFGYTNSENLVFKRCKMDYSGFTEAKLKDSKFIDSTLSWHSFIDTAPGFELRNCTEFRVFRSMDDLTPSLAEKAFEELQPVLNTLDLDMRHRVMLLMESVKSKLMPNFILITGEKSSPYEKPGKAGYGMFDSLIDKAVTTYGTNSVYKSKNAYEATGSYKSN
jgi:hypothetical protein